MQTFVDYLKMEITLDLLIVYIQKSNIEKGLLLSGKCWMQNLQNRLYSPFTAARTTKFNNQEKFTFVLQKNINIIPNILL